MASIRTCLGSITLDNRGTIVLYIRCCEPTGNLYGTSKKAVQDVLCQGKICILDIDVQGVKQVKNTDLQAQYVFIRPPSIEVCFYSCWFLKE